jgi:hypothetical protein
MEIGNDFCPNCQTSPPNFLEDPTNGHYICHDCGLVRDDQMIDHSLERRNFSDSSINHQRGQLVDPHLDMLKMSTRILPASGNKNSGNKKPKTDVARAHDALAAIGTYSLTNQHLEVYFSKIRQLAQLLDLSLHAQGVAKDIICHYEKCKGHHRRNLDITCAALSVLGKGAVPAPLNPPACGFAALFSYTKKFFIGAFWFLVKLFVPQALKRFVVTKKVLRDCVCTTEDWPASGRLAERFENCRLHRPARRARGLGGTQENCGICAGRRRLCPTARRDSLFL